MFRLTLVAMLAVASAAMADEPKKPVAPDLKREREFAEQFEQAIREGDAAKFSSFIDHKAMLDRACKGLALPADFRKGVDRGAATLGPRLFAGLMQNANPSSGDGMKLLRIHVVDGESRMLFRNLTTAGVNYLDFVLTAPSSSGKMRIVDVYVAVTGEYLSRTMGRMLGRGLVELRNNKDNPAGLADAVDEMLQTSKFINLVRTGKHKEALEEWPKLSAAMKKDKAVMLMHVMATGSDVEGNPAAYEKSIESFVKRFPNDPAVDLVSLDGYLLKKRYGEYQKALDRIDKAIGGDPFLQVLRANGYVQEGKLAEAKKAVRKAIAAEPDLIPAYYSQADVALAEKDYKELARVLTLLESRFGIDFSGVSTTEDYAEFRKSAEYKEWWQKRTKK